MIAIITTGPASVSLLLALESKQVMDEIKTLLDRMTRIGLEVRVYGPAQEDVIPELEVAFGERMPPSYRAFLTQLGGVSILDSSYSGLIDGKINEGGGWAWTDGLTAREHADLAPHLLVVQPDDDGYKCLDFSQRTSNGECPVIYQWPHLRQPHQIAASFGAWLMEDLRQRIVAFRDDP